MNFSTQFLYLKMEEFHKKGQHAFKKLKAHWNNKEAKNGWDCLKSNKVNEPEEINWSVRDDEQIKMAYWDQKHYKTENIVYCR